MGWKDEGDSSERKPTGEDRQLWRLDITPACSDMERTGSGRGYGCEAAWSGSTVKWKDRPYRICKDHL